MARCLDRRSANGVVFSDRQMGARALPRKRRRRFCIWGGEFSHYLIAVDLLLGADSSFWSRVHPGIRRSVWLSCRTGGLRCSGQAALGSNVTNESLPPEKIETRKKRRNQ